MSLHVALLRGVNVGGAHRLPMARLAEIFARCGASYVETLLQSGNALFEAPDGASVAFAVETELLATLGFAAPIILRSAAQWAEIVAKNPFAAEGADPAHLHVAVWNGDPSPSRLATLDPIRSPGESVLAGHGCLYLRLPNGVAHSKLTSARLDSSVGATCTLRNWTTAQRLSIRLGQLGATARRR